MELVVNNASCRTCLAAKEDTETIFDNNYNGENLNAILMFLVPINVQRNDGLSDKICLNCKKRLVDAYEFRKMVIQSNEYAKAFKLLQGKYKKPTKNIFEDVKIEAGEECQPVEMDAGIEYEVIENENLESPDEENFIMESEDSEPQNEDIVPGEPVGCKIEYLNYPATEEDFEESYNCNDCDLMFENPDILLEHLKQEHTKTKNVGKENHPKFDIKPQLEKEVLVNTLKQEYEQKQSLKKHKCDMCDKSFMYPSKVERHKKAVHKEGDNKRRNTKKLTLFCQVCNKGFPHHSKLVIHMRTHGVKDDNLLENLDIPKEPEDKQPRIQHSCLECGKNFYTTQSYEKHQILHSDFANKCLIHEPREFQCSICLQRSEDFDSFNAHLKAHKNDNIKKFVCKLCEESFNDFNILIQHTRKHEENATHRCIICDRYFYFSKSFIEHIQNHQGTAEFSCGHCGKFYTSDSKLSVHLETHTRTLKDYKYECEYCLKKFYNKNYFKNHIKIHGDKLFACQICDKKFTFLKGLKLHNQIHVEKLFKCEFCSTKFAHRHALNKHLEKHYRKYECDNCDRKFTSKNYLTQHMAMHLKANIFRCGFCRASFARPEILKSHMMTHMADTSQESDNLKYSTDSVNVMMANGSDQAFTFTMME